MLKKFLVTIMLIGLSACSSIPFMGISKPVIDLDEEKIDQKSYAIAYSTTVQSNKGLVKDDYDVNSFASGVNDWYLGRILVSVDQIRAKLASGIDSNVHAYYSGVVFAAQLQSNFSRLNANCWSQVDRSSMTQGIYDAMLDLQEDRAKSEDDEYLTQGSEQFMQSCL